MSRYTHEAYLLNRNSILARQRRWLERGDNREKMQAQQRRHYYLHREKRLKLNAKWRLEHREQLLSRRRSDRQSLKHEVLAHYSGDPPKCQRCGFQDIRALSVGHIRGNGKKHRMQIGQLNLHEWLKRQGYPEGFQVLCMNCQWIKRVENNELGGVILRST